MPSLFEPLQLRGLCLRNRTGLAPLCQYWAGDDGMPTDWHLVHLGSRAIGGAGLVMAEMTAIEPEGRISPRDTGLWSDAHIEPWQRITRFIAQFGAASAMQLGHAGRKASIHPSWAGSKAKEPLPPAEGGWINTYAPSPLVMRPQDKVPQAMTHEDIARVKLAYREAARRSLDAGFDVVELHCAHGYLQATFLSPFSNQRNDAYGGSFENRIRFTLECVREIRSVWPEDKPLAVRLSCSEWIEDGWQLEDSIALSQRLKAEGVDLIDCSSGLGTAGGRYPRYPIAPGWQVKFAEAIRREVGIPTAAVGMITSPLQADSIIRDGRADLILVGTEMLNDPYWPFHAAQTLGPFAGNGVQLPVPYQYVVGNKERYQPLRSDKPAT